MTAQPTSISPRPAGRALLLLGVLVAALGAFGCPRAAAPPLEPRPAPPEPSPLERADALFEAGDEAAALAAYEEHLAGPASEGTARALFRMGLLLVTPGSPVADPRRGRELLRTLVREHPESAYRAPAEYLLALQGEAAELRRQLEEIKRIDLEGG